MENFSDLRDDLMPGSYMLSPVCLEHKRYYGRARLSLYGTVELTTGKDGRPNMRYAMDTAVSFVPYIDSTLLSKFFNKHSSEYAKVLLFHENIKPLPGVQIVEMNAYVYFLGTKIPFLTPGEHIIILHDSDDLPIIKEWWCDVEGKMITNGASIKKQGWMELFNEGRDGVVLYRFE